MTSAMRFLLVLCLVGLPARSYANYAFDLKDGLGHRLGNLVLPVADCELVFGPAPDVTICPTATIDFATGINLYNNTSAFQIATTGWHFDGSHFTGLSQIYFVLNSSPDGDGLTLDLTLGFFYEYRNWLGGGQGDPPIASGPVMVTLVTGQDIPEPSSGILLLGVAVLLHLARPKQMLVARGRFA